MKQDSRQVTQVATPNAVNLHYDQAHTSRRLDSFLAGALTIVSLSEMIGPLIGWPTISGLCFQWAGLSNEPVQIWQMILVTAVQIGILIAAGYCWWQTSWPRWLAARSKNSAALLTPEAHLRETVEGALVGLLVEVLATVQVSVWLQHALRGDGALQVTELIIIVLSAAFVAVRLSISPKDHFGVVHPDGDIYERINQAPVRAEMTLNPTNFEKSILLRANASGFEFWDKRAVIELHTASHLLINLGEFEKKIQGSVEVSSANAFRASGRFSASVHLPGIGAPVTLNHEGVDVLLRNLYDKSDLLGFLTSQLSIAMNEYAGQFDAEAKTIVEDLRIKLAKYESRLARDISERPSGLPALSSTDTSQAYLRMQQSLAEEMFKELEAARSHWAGARSLHQNAKVDLPRKFNRILRNTFRAFVVQDGAYKASVDTIESLMDWAYVQFHVETFEITGSANQVEQLLDSAMERTMADLRLLRERVFEDKKAREAEIRGILDTMLSKIDPNTLTTAKRAVFLELLRIRSMTSIDMSKEELFRMQREILADDTASPALPHAPSPDFPPPRPSGDGLGEAQVRRVLRDKLTALPAPLLTSSEAQRMIDLFVRRHKNDSMTELSRNISALVVQLGNIESFEDEPT